MIDAPRVAAIGDSLIYGRHDPAGGWVGRCRELLEKRWPNGAMFNLGIGGETVIDVRNRFRIELEPREPNCVVVGVGTNDSRRHLSRMGSLIVDHSDYAHALREIVAEALSRGRRVMVASVLPVDPARTDPLDEFYYRNEDLRLTWECQRGVCGEAGAKFLDFWSLVASDFAAVSSDGLHLTSEGHTRLSRYAFSAICEEFPG